MQEHAGVQAALDRERHRSATIQERCKALEQDLEESAMDYEVNSCNASQTPVTRALYTLVKFNSADMWTAEHRP